MHIYLLILGFGEREIANFMVQSKGAKTAKKALIRNIFTQPKIPNVDKIVSETTGEFKKVYNLSQELSYLANIFKINQGLLASGGALLSYFNSFERIMAQRFRVFNSTTIGKTFVEQVINDKPYLTDFEENIKAIYEQALRVGLIYKQNSNMYTNLDLDLYFKDFEYKELVKSFYNLIKGTYNVFDIIDSLPHYKELIEAT